MHVRHFLLRAQSWHTPCAVAGLAFVLLVCLGQSLEAARKSAPEILPENTLAMIRVSNTPELIEKFQETAIGRIGQDKDVKPLVGQLYASAAEAFGEIQERVGMPLAELLSIPQGEICVAVVGLKEGPPVVVLMLDAAERLVSAQKLIDRAEAAMAEGGGVKSTEVVGDVKFVVHEFPRGNRQQRVVHFQKDGTIVLATDLGVAKQLLDSWNGGEAPTLVDNKRFAAIMNRCSGSKDERPQVTWFVDPIELFRVASRGDFRAQAALAVLPVVGLDGLQSVGGSMAFSQGEFDTVMHLHVLLSNPRAGVIDMLALREGDATPEPWVPGDISSYTTFFWDADYTFQSGAKMYDQFFGPGALSGLLRTRFSERVGIDFEKEVLPELDGRFTMANRIEKPVRINSQTTLIAARLKDPRKFQTLFDRMLEKYRDNLEKNSFGGVTYYKIKVPGGPDRAGREGLELRREEPCVALLDDYLVGTNSVSFLEQAIVTKSDPSRSLSNELDFKLIASKIGRQAGGAKPGLVTFSRPEEGMRMMYELATSEDTRRVLSSQAENNRFFKTLETALKDHPLPPFAVFAKYFAPGGGMITSDESGFHYTDFTLKRK